MPSIDLTEYGGNVISDSSEHVTIAHVCSPGNAPTNIESSLRDRVYMSWRGCLTVSAIDAIENSGEPSLRQPQISALFEILGHLTSHDVGDATVVMPTGTGKTETMLAAVCGLPVFRALVIVPTDSLRAQTVKKFLSLGKLRELNAINESANNPVVALLQGAISSNDELEMALMANVIVATPQSIYQINSDLRASLCGSCSHLLVDEAHHVKAPTWGFIKSAFAGKPVVQFTATPFRKDRKKIDGKIIFNYPMSVAQKEGTFRPITFKSIYEVNDVLGDERVAEEAVSILRRDIGNGYDHILMARCRSRARADSIFELYRTRYADLNPVLIHSGVRDQRRKFSAIVEKQHRIVVCVDMLGEGFDLPELKVCALHDVHKSLAITLQFAGRFVRDRGDLGNPTFVANVCDQSVEEAISDLYIEDPDWNRVLRRVSESSVERELMLQEIVADAVTSGLDVPPENINPALSALVYRVTSATLSKDINLIPWEKNEELISSSVSVQANLAIFLTKVESKTKWAPQSDLTQPEWRLVIIHYVAHQNLLFIHDSSKSGMRKKLAEYFGASAMLLNGDQVFKCFGNIERLVLQNAGLNRGRRGPLRYVMYTGIDIESAINDLAQGASYKSNLFGKGFREGEKVTIGCSYKGRVWSMESASVPDWMTWCSVLGKNLIDSSVDPNKILDKVLRTREVDQLPGLHPIGVDWPDGFYEGSGLTAIVVEALGAQVPVDEADISIATHERCLVEFFVSFGCAKARYRYCITSGGYAIEQVEGESMHVTVGNRRYELSRYFNDEASPSIFFEDGSKIFENLHIVRPEDFSIPHISRQLMHKIVWDVDIRKESQGERKVRNSIQFAMIQRLKKDGYWLIVDDDGPNEIADIVAFKDEGKVLGVELYHLKFSSEAIPGSRVSDFYEVCGQVVKSCKWVGELDNIINRLKKRERSRVNRIDASRIELGTYKDFDLIKQHGSRLKKEYRIFVVQPGLDMLRMSDDVAALLGSTELYVRETTSNPLVVLCS